MKHWPDWWVIRGRLSYANHTGLETRPNGRDISISNSSVNKLLRTSMPSMLILGSVSVSKVISDCPLVRKARLKNGLCIKMILWRRKVLLKQVTLMSEKRPSPTFKVDGIRLWWILNSNRDTTYIRLRAGSCQYCSCQQCIPRPCSLAGFCQRKRS
jgi:hypothetical protein